MRPYLHMTRVLPAPRADVFAAMTEEKDLARWWGPKGFTTRNVEIDPRPGCSYEIDMQPPDGDAFRLSGEFLQVDPPTRLVYTFRWDPPDPDDRETLVTISLEARGGRTEVELTQGEFTTEERRALHEGGWSESLERLRELLEGSLR
jgi:uncharacterized protein YndB with AHSA1/START domain